MLFFKKDSQNAKNNVSETNTFADGSSAILNQRPGFSRMRIALSENRANKVASSKVDHGMEGLHPAEEIAMEPMVSAPDAIVQTLKDATEIILAKIEDGALDSQALPLLDSLITMIGELATIQQEREQVQNEVVTLLKDARKKAYDSLCKMRQAREVEIEAVCNSNHRKGSSRGRRAA